MRFGAPIRLLRLISLIRSRLEYGNFMLQDLSNKLLLELNRIQYQALRLIMRYKQSTPINVILCEAKEPPLLARFRFLERNFLSSNKL